MVRAVFCLFAFVLAEGLRVNRNKERRFWHQHAHILPNLVTRKTYTKMSEEEPKTEDTKTEEKKDEVYDGVVTGKYNWAAAGKKSADDEGSAITKYSWSDGKKTVSIYVEMDGIDDVPEDQITCDSTEKEACLHIVMGGKKKTLRLTGLSEAIDGAKAVKKKGKNMAQLKLTKKEEQPWSKLLSTSSSGGGGGDDDDEEGGDPMGGMGGMGGGMGGMGGGGMGGMDMNAMMAQMQGMGGMGGMGM